MHDVSEGVRHRVRGRKELRPTENVLYSSNKGDSFVLLNSTAYAALGFIIALSTALAYLDGVLPRQLTLRDETFSPESFIGERAQRQLEELTKIGTRVVGSYENEVLAIDFLLREISLIRQQSNSLHNIEVDIQKPTGSYYLDFKPYGFRNYYANIQNIVVKLSSGNHSTSSVLINSHYDTVPESPGASDNGINCVVMLEVLRVLAKQKTPLQNNVIFLFNGAEENPLQAAHGFITQHKWSKEVKAVINLDSAGGGAKEVLFQSSSTHPWLLRAYAKAVPHPFGGVPGEELFQSGVIPSDTDFRVFRDFGKVPGLDFAQYSNGYIYHTRLDKIDYISHGAYQHTGDNILALTKELISSPELSEKQASETVPSRVVYFDVLGLFMVVYSEWTATFLNLGCVVLSFYTIFKITSELRGGSNILVEILLSGSFQLTSWLLSGTMVLLVSKTLLAFNASLSWYSHPWYIIPLYILPIIISNGLLPLLVIHLGKKKESRPKQAIRFLNGSQFVWTIILIAGTLLGIRTSFIVMLFVVFPSAATLVTITSQKPLKVKKYIVNYLLSALLPIIFILCQANRALTLLLPVAGRMGPQSNPELVIGLASVIFYTFVASYTVPLIVLLKKPKTVLTVLTVIHVISMILVIGTPLGFPYKDDPASPALQRFLVMHTERTFHDDKGNVRKSDSGFSIQGLDRNNLNYMSEIIPQIRSAQSVGGDCERELYCGVPVFTSRSLVVVPHSYWIPTLPPLIHHPTSLEVVSQTMVSVNVRRIHIKITGPDHVTIIFSPHENNRLVKWSFDEFEPKEGPLWKSRPTFMVYYSHGLVGGTLDFSIDLEVGKNSKLLMDVAVIGHYMHDKASRTEEFKTFLSQFPEWAHVTPWTSTFKSWVV